MKLHIIGQNNSHHYEKILNQHHRIRHQVFVEKMGWKDLYRADGLDFDEFDNPEAIQLCLTREGSVVGGSRLNPSTGATLLKTRFSYLVQKTIPSGPGIADWTRLYIAPNRNYSGKNSEEASAIYYGIMEYALSEKLQGLTFVAYLQLIHLFVSLGWRVDPLGVPNIVDGKPTIAALLHVNEDALKAAKRLTKKNYSLLCWGGSQKPSIGIQCIDKEIASARI